MNHSSAAPRLESLRNVSTQSSSGWSGAPLSVLPVLNSELQLLLRRHELLFELIRGFGSPLNIVFPEEVRKGVDGFSRVLAGSGLKGAIYFAHKANKSSSFIRELSTSSARVDVASAAELRHALAHGIPAARLEATGPKNDEFLALALQHGVVTCVNSWSELECVGQLSSALGLSTPPEILVRVGGAESYCESRRGNDSQFGVPLDDVSSLLDQLCRYSTGARPQFVFRGFSSHLNSPSENDRIRNLETLLELTILAQERRLPARCVNIGGGFRVNFVESEAQWNEYLRAVKAEALGSCSLGWNRCGLGFRVIEGTLTGAPHFATHYSPAEGPADLSALLKQPLPRLGAAHAADAIRDLLLELWIEPGRSLVAHAGATIAEVLDVKRSAHGEAVVVLDMNRTHLSAVELELMTDPFVVTQGGKSVASQPMDCFLAGNLCLSSDLISRHRVFLAATPRRGDLLVFANTGGYHMDFAEGTPLMQRTASKVAIRTCGEELLWFADEQYRSAVLTRGLSRHQEPLI